MKNSICVLFLIICLGYVAIHADYFPLTTIQSWTFSYNSSQAIVIPNSPVTYDTGTVKWTIIGSEDTTGKIKTKIQQTYYLAHRVYTGYYYNDSVVTPAYDSVFSTPAISIDTIIIYQPKVDSLSNAIYFSGSTCPFAVHNDIDSVLVTDSIDNFLFTFKLILRDTVVTFSGSQYACIKTSVSQTELNNCYKGKAWLFTLADNIGPMEVKIGICPSYAGASYSESRKLTSYSTSTQIKSYFTDRSVAGRIEVRQVPGKIICNLPASGNICKTDIGIYAIQGEKLLHRSGISDCAEFQTAGLSQGVYIVRAKVGDREYIRNFVLKK
jgi:hypothetical protein